MTFLFKLFLTLHILGGSIGLLSGMKNILQKKGDKSHKLAGQVYYNSMVVAGTSALVLSIIHPNHFLFIIGLFTLYMVLSGQRYLLHKQSDKVVSNAIDWTITGCMLLSGILLIGMGVFNIFHSNMFGIVFLVFGSLGLLFVRQDYLHYTSKTTIINYWLVGHLQRMTGSYIAALTAFLAVNANYVRVQIPDINYRLLPTLLLTPLIIK